VLRSLGLSQTGGPGVRDFSVQGLYVRGERQHTFVVLYSRHARDVVAEHADMIEAACVADGGWAFRVDVEIGDNGNVSCSVDNSASNKRRRLPAAPAVVGWRVETVAGVAVSGVIPDRLTATEVLTEERRRHVRETGCDGEGCPSGHGLRVAPVSAAPAGESDAAAPGADAAVAGLDREALGRVVVEYGAAASDAMERARSLRARAGVLRADGVVDGPFGADSLDMSAGAAWRAHEDAAGLVAAAQRALAALG
jgi:hypothetical protein